MLDEILSQLLEKYTRNLCYLCLVLFSYYFANGSDLSFQKIWQIIAIFHKDYFVFSTFFLKENWIFDSW